MDTALIVIICIVVLFFIVVISNIKIIAQARAAVIERFGSYHVTWQTGLHVKVPFIDRLSRIVSLKEQVVDFAPQPVITKDNVTMQIDTVVYFQITDPMLYTYGVEHPMQAIENLTATTLRNIVGDLELDQTLTSRDTINAQMRVILDVATDPWGIKVNRVELKSIIPPREIQDAMEKQMKAERERREAILRAEGEKRSAILVAEGQKESLILKAEGEKQSTILKADAVREAKIREAEGESQSILLVQEAVATGIMKINAANPSEKAMLLKSYEALAKVADGRATKIVIPSDLQSLASLSTVVKELVTDKPASTTTDNKEA
jgi:regulator of protease activity HflC (stomatin/prohibitin superfamily)